MNGAPANIEERFTMPQNWQWGEFTRTATDGTVRRLRYGYVIPDRKSHNKDPQCSIIALSGLGEFGEKYFEFARECIAQNRGFFVIDWVGQGLSTRYLDNPQKRHSAGFDEDIADLKLWLTDYVAPQTQNAPLVMLAHSMGGNIGLRYLAKYPNIFCCAAFCAPMWGIKAMDIMPRSWARAITGQMARFSPQSYAPGGMDWNALQRPKAGFDLFSHDPVRGAVYNQWCLHNHNLQVGSVTNLWLHEAVKTCNFLFQNDFHTRVTTPFIAAVAGKEALVSNKAILSLSGTISSGRAIEFAHARHEILMEKEEIRTAFIKQYDDFIKTHLKS